MRDNKTRGTNRQARMQALIRAEAERQGVPPEVALAFAEVESRFNPNAEGDTDWHLRKGGELYRRHVLEAPRFLNNPYRTQAELWHSYGLFQLLAPWHARDGEDPRVLLDPAVNIARGVGYLRKLLERHGGDVYAARLAYTGNPTGDTAHNIVGKLERALAKWGCSDGQA